MKCAVDGGVAMVECYPLGDGRCVVEGGVVPCPPTGSNLQVTIKVLSSTKPTNCSINDGKVCVPTIAIQDPEFIAIEDSNRDGYVCFDEVSHWLDARYDDAWGKAVFPTCESFDKSRAITALKDLRAQMSAQIGRVSQSLFSDCADGIETVVYRVLQARVSQVEQGLINYTIPAAADKGAGQLGMSWRASTGEITGLRQDSDGAKGGLRLGDKIISVDGFAYSNTIDYITNQWYRVLPWISLPESDTYDALKKVGVPANSLFFGPCGSNAKVEIERDGQRMILEITRGRG